MGFGGQRSDLQKECRDAGYALQFRCCFLLANFVGGFIAFEELANARAGKTAGGSDVDEDRTVADVESLDEIGAEEIFDQSVLGGFLRGKADEPMSVEGVGSFLDEVEAEGDALLRAGFDNAGFETRGYLGAPELRNAVF